MRNLDQARKWADQHRNISDHRLNTGLKAAAEVINALPDHIIDAEEVREALEGCDKMTYPYEVIEHIEKTLFTQPLPTLAELIEAGNDPKQYQWMQADHIEHGRVIITHPGDTFIYYMKQSGLSGGVSLSASDRITPLPDLPKLEWPSLSLSGESEAVSVETEDVTEESDPAQEPQPVVKTLHTVEDYEAASIGTVVRRQELPWLAATFHKSVDGIWNSTGGHEYPSSEMAGTARTVLWEPKP